MTTPERPRAVPELHRREVRRRLRRTDVRFARPVRRSALGGDPGGQRPTTSTTPSPPRAARCDGEWGADDRLPARRADAPARRADHRERRAAGPGRGARQRQAVPGDDRPAAGAGRLVPLLRRARRQDRGPGHPDRQAQLLRLHPPRAGRCGRRDHPVELPAAADDVQAGAGPGRGVHVRGQAVRALARVHVGLRPGAGRSRLPARRVQRRSPVRAASSVPRWPGTRASTRSRSPARPRPAGPSRTPPRTTSTGSPSSWAGSRRRSSSRMPTCRRRPTASSPASSPRPARPAWPAPE